MHFTHDDRLCLPVPFYHCSAWCWLICYVFRWATAVIACEHFDAEAVLKLLSRRVALPYTASPPCLLPNLNIRILAAIAWIRCAPALWPERPVRRHDGTRDDGDALPEILIGYGETEASPLTHLTTPEDSIERRTKTVGRNLPHQEVKILDIAGDQTVR